MKRIPQTTLRFSLACIITLLAFNAQIGQAQIPATISYQGHLTDASGEPVADGTYEFTFKIYDGGTEIWSETDPAVSVTDGIFNVILGSLTPLTSLAFDQEYELGISVNGGSELSPREKLAASAYALNSRTVVDGAVTTSKIADNAVTENKIAPSAVMTDKISDFAITTIKIANASITSNKLTDGAVITDKISDSAITTLKIADSAITSNKIADGEVVKSLNGKTDEVNLVEGAGIDITESGQQITVSATGDNLGNHELTQALKLNGNPISNDGDSEGLFITDAGDVGISKTNPRASLDVPGINGGASTTFGIGSQTTTIGSYNGLATITGYNPSDGTHNDLTLRASINLEQLYLSTNGNIGIGSATPNYTVQVHKNSSSTNVIQLTNATTGSGSGDGFLITQLSDGRARVQNSEATDLSLWTSNSPRLTIDPAGQVGIGTTIPSNILTIQQNSATDPIADAWMTYSSRRWKTNIKTISGALKKVQRLRGVSYDWKADGKHDIGLIAEEVGEVIPEVVAYEENGVDAKSVDYARLVSVLIEAIKEQQKEIEALKTKNTELQQTKAELDAIKVQVAQLQSALSELVATKKSSGQKASE